MAQMTETEFVSKQAQLLDGIPPAFASWIRYECWERGHSAGRDEVIGLMQGMTYDFKKAFEEYQKDCGHSS